MAGLNKPTLGTDRVNGWMYFDCHMTSCLVLKEFFEASNYLSGIKKIQASANETIRVYEKLGLSVAREQELQDWSEKMSSEGYHELFSMAFISMWSAFEAGIENLITTYIEHDKPLAEKLHRDLGLKIQLTKWPWSFDERLGILRKIERKAMEGAVPYHTRIIKMLSYIEVTVLESEARIPHAMPNLDEASRVRNIILHRYGEVGDRDVESCPALAPWLNKTIPFNDDRFRRYNDAITVTLVAIMGAIQRSRFAIKSAPTT